MIKRLSVDIDLEIARLRIDWPYFSCISPLRSVFPTYHETFCTQGYFFNTFKNFCYLGMKLIRNHFCADYSGLVLIGAFPNTRAHHNPNLTFGFLFCGIEKVTVTPETLEASSMILFLGKTCVA